MKKKRTIILLILIVFLFSIPTYFFLTNKNDGSEKQDEQITLENNSADESTIQEAEEEIEHNLRLTIISPEEETFSVRQARMYNALVEGNGKYSNLVKCHWEFFLNQNNEETLYKVMENSGVLSGASKEMCGFTSTFIESKGILRVKLTMTVYDAVNENLETISGERTYTVL